jgi:hypothetical protein
VFVVSPGPQVERETVLGAAGMLARSAVQWVSRSDRANRVRRLFDPSYRIGSEAVGRSQYAVLLAAGRFVSYIEESIDAERSRPKH